jgi:hypothetical protein
MTCRRAFELDLAEFVADPRAERFGWFLEHYPACAECSAELRAWSELEAQLRGEAGSAHPDEEVLLHYEQSPDSLGTAERTRVATHLAACRSCADELAALRSFDFEVLAPAPAPAPARELASILAGLGERLRGLVLHPAFAYAVVLALLYPTARWVLQDIGVLPASAPPLALGSLEAPAPAGRPSQEAEQLGRSGAADALVPEPVEVFASRVEKSEAAARPPAPAPRALPDSGLPRADRDLAASKERAPRPESTAKLAPTADERELDERARGALSGGLAYRLAPAEAEEEATALRELAAGAESPVLRQPLADAPQRRKELRARAAGEVAALPVPAPVFDPGSSTLSVPLPELLAPDAVVEIRVTSPDGAREIRERFAVGVGVTRLEMKLPAAWLAPGTYRVERRIRGVEASIERTSEFRVEIP